MFYLRCKLPGSAPPGTQCALPWEIIDRRWELSRWLQVWPPSSLPMSHVSPGSWCRLLASWPWPSWLSFSWTITMPALSTTAQALAISVWLGDTRVEAATLSWGGHQKNSAPRLTYDKCECRGHGDGQDNEEDGHGPPAAWAAAAEIFGEVCEALRGWQLAARLDWAQRVEIALKSSRQLLQLSWAPARCKVTSQKIISLSTFASLRTNLVLFWLILFKSSSMSPTSTQFGFS